MPSLLKKFSGLTGGGQGLRLLERRAAAGDRPQRHGHDLRPLDDAEPLPLLPDLGDRPRRLPDRVADRPRPARAHLPGRARQRGRGGLGRGSTSPARRRSPSRSAASTPASRARCSRSRTEIVNPLTFTFLLSILLLVGAVVGGLGSLPGMVVGAFFVQYLPDLSTRVSSKPGVPGLRLRRRDHPRDDPAPDRSRRPAAPSCQTPNNPAIPSSLEGR